MMMFAEGKRGQIQMAYVRICKDSGFKMDAIDAANLTARIMGCHGIEVMGALGFKNMKNIASGAHPSAR